MARKCSVNAGNSMNGETVSIAEASKRLGVSKPTIYAAIANGRIPAIQLTAHRVVIPRPAFERLLRGEPLGTVEVVATRLARTFAAVLVRAHGEAMAEALLALQKACKSEEADR